MKNDHLTIEQLFGDSDPKIKRLQEAIHNAIDERARSVLSLAAILGVLQCVAHDLLMEEKQ